MRDNLTLVCLRTLTKHGVVDVAKQREIVDRFIESLGIKLRSPDQPIRELSGGNQQKVLLARWLATNPKLLLLDEPTRGIDVGAKADVAKIVRELRDSGLAVLLSASELEELTAVADRAVVIRDGETVAELDGARMSEASIMDAIAYGSGEAIRRWRKRVDPKAREVMGYRQDTTGAAAPLVATDARRKDIGITIQREIAVLLAMIVFNLLFTQHFWSLQTFNVNLTQVVTIVIVGIGMTLVVATGGIDLSVGASMAISGALAPMLFMNIAGPFGIALAFVLPVLAAALCGVFNGFLVTRLSVQPIVATLVLFIAGRGIAQVVTDGSLQAFNNPAFQWIALGKVAGVPFQVFLMLALVALFAWIVRKTLFGQYLLVTGGNEQAAYLSGIPTARVKMIAYTVCAALAGLAGLISISVNSSSDANVIGLGSELDAIAAVAVGGTALTGGKAYIAGTLIGALIIQLLRYTLLAHGIPDAAALVVKAGIIIAAVYVQRRRH